ncbi:MAG TPA: heme o synthase [Candidatus Saccharimonadales bacterium]|nr:heme o synthase [Candidatus Saccharimonadales bacterium]
MQAIRVYYKLAKPGIVYGNLLTTAAGYFLASGRVIQPLIGIGLLIGIGFVMGSACVLNNIMDRGIDRKMKRTKGRVLVTGEVSVPSAAVYAGVLGLAGFALLAIYTNLLTVVLGAVAMFLYVVAYGIAKRRTIYSTLIGTIPGAMPPVAGYVAVTNVFDGAAWLLFIALMVWQMAHFYSIAIYRQKEYKAADLPIMSVKRGIGATKQQIVFYIILFIPVVFLFTYFSYTGIVFAVGMVLISSTWLTKALRGYKGVDSEKWARGLFGFSLKVLLVFCLLLSVDAWLV